MRPKLKRPGLWAAMIDSWLRFCERYGATDYNTFKCGYMAGHRRAQENRQQQRRARKARGKKRG